MGSSLMTMSHRPGARLLATCAFLAVHISIGTAIAQTGETVRDTTARMLPPIRVVGSLLPIVSPRVGSGLPGKSEMIDSAELRAWKPRLAFEPLARQANISMYDDLGSAFKLTAVARGFTASPVVGLPQGISVFIDGVPVNEPDAGQVNFDLLPLAHAKAIEHVAGTASLLGPHSLGGALNIVTRRGGGPLRGEVELAAGSHGKYSIEGSTTGSVGGLAVYAGGGHATERGWRQLTGANVANAFVNVGRFGQRRGVGAQLMLARSRAETAGSLPESVYGERPDSNLSAGDFEDLDQVHLALTGYGALGAGTTSFNLFGRRHTAERFNVNQIDDPDVRGFSRNISAGGMADWNVAFPLAIGTAGIRIGGGGQASSTSIRLFAERMSPGLTTDVRSPLSRLDAFATGEYAAGPITVTAGLRYDVVRIPFRNLLRPERDTTSTFFRTSPRIGIGVDAGRGLHMYASAGQSFRAPAVIELACADPEEPCPLPFALGDDPPLDPVIATTWEAGARWARGNRQLRISTYRTNVANDIFLLPYEEENEPDQSTIDGFFANIPRTRREGIEVDARVGDMSSASAYGSYAFTRGTFQSEAEIFSVREASGQENEVAPGDNLPLIPAHTVSLGATAAFRALRIGSTARYTGRRWLRGDEANETSPLEAYWGVDARGEWRMRQWAVGVIVDNLFDRRFATFGTFNLNQAAGNRLERFLTPGARRNMQIVLRRSFGSVAVE